VNQTARDAILATVIATMLGVAGGVVPPLLLPGIWLVSNFVSLPDPYPMSPFLPAPHSTAIQIANWLFFFVLVLALCAPFRSRSRPSG